MGQELSKAKHDREERQAHDIVNQIKEDRAKERAHREAVRQQIARDRAEREARRQNELQERQCAQAAAAAPSGAMMGSHEQQGRGVDWYVLVYIFVDCVSGSTTGFSNRQKWFEEKTTTPDFKGTVLF